MNVGVSKVGEQEKDKRMVLREESLKKEKKKRKEKPVEVKKAEEKELLREVTVKIELERIDMQEEVEVLQNSGETNW